MPDTADNEMQAAGQPDGSADDAVAEQMLAEAIQEPEQQEQAGRSQDDQRPQQQGAQQNASNDPWADPNAARKEIEKLRRESANWRTKYREAEPQLSEYQKYLDSQKTEQQKLQEAKESAERELTNLRTTNARLMAAATHDIPADLIDLLGSGTEEEINARAELLAQKLAAAVPPPAPAEPERKAPAQTRPVESLTAGGQPADAKPMDMDTVLRTWAGRT